MSFISESARQLQVSSSGFIEILEEDIPPYETSQLQQQRQRQRHDIERTNSSGSLHSRLPRNTSLSSFQDTAADRRSSSVVLSKHLNEERRNLKRVGLQFLNSRQLFGLALGRDLSLLAIVRDLYKVLREWYELNHREQEKIDMASVITNARSSEFLMAALWCIVSGYFTYQILDSLMLRWIIIYSPSAVILRMVSMSMFIIMIIHLLTMAFNADGNYYLHVWILISCALTGIYILQSFVTSNLSIDNYDDDDGNNDDDDDDDENDDTERDDDGTIDITKKKKARFIDLYNITVFAVVPVGVASFITMIGLIRNLLILKLDIDHLLQTR